jgi:hypothetical protein
MAAVILNISVAMIDFGQCCRCGATIAGPQEIYLQAMEKRGPLGKQFYCINGHQQHYTGETEAQKERRLREDAELRLVVERRATERAKRSAAAYQGKLTTLRDRVQNGVCPCCNRTFQNLMRHMKTKHPGYDKADI